MTVPEAPTLMPPSSRLQTTNDISHGVPNLPDQPYDTLEALLNALNAWGRQRGVGFTKMRPSNYVNGSPTRYEIACDRGGREKTSKAMLRRTTTSKTGCPWFGVAKALAESDRKWTFEAKIMHHNHEITAGDVFELTTHRGHRGLTDAMKADVATLSLNASQRPRDIVSYLRRTYPDTVFTAKDVENYRQRLQRDKQDGKTPTQTLLQILRDTDTYHVVRTDPADPDKITGLFWTYAWCVDMWKKYPWVLQLDNTYKTNRFNMPLFQVTGVTNVATTFNARFGLVDNECEDGFMWLAHQLLTCQIHHGIQRPGVVITDFERALKNALKCQFPETHQQICVFHVNKNVVLNIKRKWKKPSGQSTAPNTEDEAVADPLLLDQEDQRQLYQLNQPLTEDEDPDTIRLPCREDLAHSPAGMYALWKFMVYCQDDSEFDEAWARFKEEFPEQEAIIGYIETHYLPYKEQWAHPWTSRLMNFGQRTTSPTETAHRELKAYLVNGKSGLLKLHEVILEMLANKETAYKERIATQKRRLRTEFLGQGFAWLGSTNREVSYRAIDKVNQQKKLAIASRPGGGTRYPGGRPLRPCTGRFTNQ